MSGRRPQAASTGTRARQPVPSRRDDPVPITAVLQQALHHVDRAALALSDQVPEQGRAVALAQLEELHRLLSAVAYESTLADERAAPRQRAARRTPTAGALRPDDGPALVLRAPLHRDPRAIRTARASCTRACQGWGLPTAAASTVVDLASELVSNAVRHAGGALELALERHAGHVHVSVSDASSEPPRLLPYRAGLSDHGIGLQLVDQLSTSWGWHSTPEGKCVWADASTSGGPAA